MKKVIVYFSIVYLLLLYFPLSRYLDFYELKQNVEIKRMELENIPVKEEKEEAEEVYDMSEYILGDNLFLNTLYSQIKKQGMEVVGISGLILKDSGLNEDLVYREVVIKGTLLDLYNFLKNIYQIKKIDTSHTQINLNEKEFRIFLGYLRSRV